MKILKPETPTLHVGWPRTKAETQESGQNQQRESKTKAKHGTSHPIRKANQSKEKERAICPSLSQMSPGNQAGEVHKPTISGHHLRIMKQKETTWQPKDGKRGCPKEEESPSPSLKEIEKAGSLQMASHPEGKVKAGRETGTQEEAVEGQGTFRM